MKRLFVAATVALMLVVWVGSAFARGRDDSRNRRSRGSEARNSEAREDDRRRTRRHVRNERSRQHETRRSRKTHTRHRTRVYYFPSDYGSGRARAYNDECD